MLINFFSRVSTRCCIEDILPSIFSKLFWILSMSLSWSCFNLSEPVIFSELFSVLFCFDARNIFRLSVTDLLHTGLSFLSVSNILQNKINILPASSTNFYNCLAALEENRGLLCTVGNFQTRGNRNIEQSNLNISTNIYNSIIINTPTSSHPPNVYVLSILSSTKAAETNRWQIFNISFLN